MKGEIRISFKMFCYSKIRNHLLKTEMQTKSARKSFFSNWCVTLRNSHSPELHWAGLHSQTAKSITTKGSPGWKKSPGKVTWGLFIPLQMHCSLSGLAGAGREWPFVRRPRCSFQWHNWPSGWNHPPPLQLPHGGAEGAQWADPDLPHGSAARGSQGQGWGCHGVCTGFSKRCSSELWALGLFAAEISLNAARDVTETWGWERGAEPWGGRGERSQRAPVESAAVTEEREVKKGRGKKKALTVPQGQGLLSFQMPTAFQT